MFGKPPQNAVKLKEMLYIGNFSIFALSACRLYKHYLPFFRMPFQLKYSFKISSNYIITRLRMARIL